MAEHRPDVKALTPIETQHVTATCRANRGQYPAWEDAVHRLLHVYEQQVFRRHGATVSLALYVTDPPDSTDPVEAAPGYPSGYAVAGDFSLFAGTHPDVPAPGRSGEEKFVECQLPVGWEWCGLRIGHAGECDPRPSAKEGRAANALTRPESDAGLPADGEERK